MNGTPTHKAIFGEVPELKHNPDGSGTRDTNPLYHGKYTIEDFEADGKIQTKKFMENPERVREFWKFEAKRRFELYRFYPEEGERVETARAEALKRYTGQREWPHGYTLASVMNAHAITIGRYFTQYYEISDNKLADAMDKLIAEDVRIVKRMCAAHETVLKAMDEDTEWPEMLEKANRALRIVNRPTMPEIEGKEGLARLAIQSEWAYVSYDDGTDKNPLPELVPSGWIICIKSVLKRILETDGRTADAMEHLDALGEGYGPLREYIREKHGEDWIYAVRVSPEDLEWSIIEKLDYGDSPPESITPEIEQRIREIIDEFGEPSRKAAERLEERVRQLNEAIDARTRAEIAAEIGMSEADGFLKETNLSKFPDKFAMPINSFTQNSRRSLQQTFNDDGTFDRAKDLILESRKNKDNKEWLKMNLMTGGFEPPSFAEIGFLEQLEAEIKAAIKEGEPLTFTAAQLCKRRYGISSKKRLSDSTYEKFTERLDELSNMKVLIPERKGLKAVVKSDAGDYLGSIVGKEVRLIDPTVKWVYNDKKEDSVTKVFIFDRNHIPIHYVNIWHGNIVRLNWDLLQTDPIPADELSP